MSSEIDHLLDAASELARAEGDDASESYWRAVTELHAMPMQSVFDRSLSWCGSTDSNERRLGADVLGQLGAADGSYPFRSASIPVLRLLLSDRDADVIQSTLIAFGHLGAQESVTQIVLLSGHSDPSVRHAVAVALLGNDAELAVKTLIELSRDPSAEVRDWATFGLGAQIDTDTPAIREALFARTEDSDPDARAEALSGLARRRDARVLAPLRRALKSGTVGSVEVEAAGDFGSADLLDALQALRSWWDVDPALLESAIAACSKTIVGGAG